MKVSVVLTTYNGSKYIEEQLDSIKRQTSTPDEVLIFDDKSTDQTPHIVQRYIAENQLENWYVFINDRNIGCEQNFINAMDMAKSEYIFTCDQDDIWDTTKIDRMTKVMDNRSEINLLVSNYETLYSSKDAKIIHNKNRCKFSHDEIIQIQFDSHFSHVLFPGCTYCIKNSFYRSIRKWWLPYWYHDSFLWTFAIITDTLYLLNLKLIQFRRHNSNTSSDYSFSLNNRIRVVKLYIERLNRCIEYIGSENRINRYLDKMKTIMGSIAFNKLRLKILQTGNFYYWLKSVLKYSTYYSSIRSYFGDLFYFYFSKDR